HRVDGEANIGPILARGSEAIELYEVDRVVQQVRPEVPIARPVAVGAPDHEPAASLQQLHDGGKVEFLVNLLGAHGHVLEVDENTDVRPLVLGSIGHNAAPRLNWPAIAGREPSRRWPRWHRPVRRSPDCSVLRNYTMGVRCRQRASRTGTRAGRGRGAPPARAVPGAG